MFVAYWRKPERGSREIRQDRLFKRYLSLFNNRAGISTLYATWAFTGC